MENKKMVCDFCNNEVEDLMEVGNYELCEECLDERTTVCDLCGERVFTEDMESVYSHEECEDIYVCNDCYYDEVSECDCCNHVFLRSDLRDEVNHYDDDVEVCEECFSEREFYCEYHERIEIDTSAWEDNSMYVNNYGRICMEAYENSGEFSYCEDCGELYHFDNLEYLESDDCCYCYDCIENHRDEGYITCYHDHEYDEKFISKKEFKENVNIDNTFFFGVELEVEANKRMATDKARMSEILYDMDEDSILAFERDGSLHNGFEIITQPMSFEYIKENKKFFMDMMESLRHNGYDSFNTNTCGHHIHMSKSPLTDRQQVLFVAVFEFFRQEFTTLSRRDESKLERWATFITRNYDKDQLNNSEVFESLLNILLHQCNRYRAINVCNTHTLESRIWRGTLDSLEYLARIELMYNVAMYVKENTEELYEMVFDNSDLFELNLYDIVTYKSNEFIIEYLSCNGFMSVVNTKLSMNM